MVNVMKEINIENLKDLKNIEEYLNSNYIINSMNIKEQNLFNYNADELEFSYSSKLKSSFSHEESQNNTNKKKNKCNPIRYFIVSI